MIDIHQLYFQYADSGFSLQLDALRVTTGEKVAVIGPSGTGKSTLLDLISGNRLPDQGSVSVLGKRVSEMSDAQRRAFRMCHLGMVFQRFELLDYLNVQDNVLLPYRISPALDLDQTVRQRAMSLAQQLGIGDKLRRPVDQLSQGERQRVAVCRALLTQPQVLLCDEPTGNLDLANKQQVLDILMHYAQQADATLLVVTHDADLVERFDRVIDFRDLTSASSATGEEAGS